MTLMEAKEQILRLADIKTHMAEAGFVQASRGQGWHCGFHDDRSASVSVRDNKAHCWTCNRIWDVIEIPMQASGEDFVATVKRLSIQYGIKIDRYKPPEGVDYQDLRRERINAEYWKIGMVYELEFRLEDAKSRLFRLDGIDQVAAMWVRQLDPQLSFVKNHNAHQTIEAYRDHVATDKREAERIMRLGMNQDEEARLVTNEIVKMMEAANG